MVPHPPSRGLFLYTSCSDAFFNSSVFFFSSLLFLHGSHLSQPVPYSPCLQKHPVYSYSTYVFQEISRMIMLKGEFQGLSRPRNLEGQTSSTSEFKPDEEMQPAGLQFPNRL